MSTFNKEYRSILEGIVDNKDYQFIVTFDPTTNATLLSSLKKVLDVLSQFHDSTTTIKETENNQIVYTVESPDKWNLSSEDERQKFARAFYNSLKAIMSQHKINVPYTARYKNKYEDMAIKHPELKGIFEDARAHSGNDILFQNVYATFDKIKDESLLNEFKKCLIELKTTLENPEGVGRANLANCECEIQKNKNEFTFIVKRVPFTEIEADPKQKHHAENNLNHKLWECLWFIMNNKNNNNSKRDWLRAHLSVNKYVWKESKMEDLLKKLPELEGIFESNIQNAMWKEGHKTKYVSILKEYGLIDPVDLNDVDDFKELWMFYQVDDTSFIEKTFKFLSSCPKTELDEYQLSLKKLNDPMQFAIIAKGNDKFFNNIPRSVYTSQIGHKLSYHVINKINEMYRYLKYSDEDSAAIKWAILPYPFILGIKTKWKELTDKLPELEGIFESNTELVDLVIQLDKTDLNGIITTPKVLEMIAKWIRQHAAIQYEQDWSVERVDTRYNWEIKSNPPCIIFKDIDTSVIDVNMYIDAIKNACIRWFDHYREDIWEACNNYRPELHKFKYSIDKNGPKTRNMMDKLPELKGIF